MLPLLTREGKLTVFTTAFLFLLPSTLSLLRSSTLPKLLLSILPEPAHVAVVVTFKPNVAAPIFNFSLNNKAIQPGMDARSSTTYRRFTITSEIK